jgi:hypothetical protein
MTRVIERFEGDLTDHQLGSDDDIPVTGGVVFGDAATMHEFSRGGHDTFELHADIAVIFGDAGAMFDFTRGGNDSFEGSGVREISGGGDAAFMSNFAQGGDDVLNVTAAARLFVNFWGDAQSTMSDFARGGDDTLTASGLNVTLGGDGGDMSGHTRGGDDVLTATTLVSGRLFGDAGTMSGFAQGGDDVLSAQTGSSIFTHAGNFLYGDAETLSDFAQGGNDRLISGTGTDHMYGDAASVAPTARTGEDTFVFGPQSGQDFIHDFEPGEDHIEVVGSVESFDDLDIESADANGDGVTDSIVHFDETDSVIVYDIAQLTDPDFIFVA